MNRIIFLVVLFCNGVMAQNQTIGKIHIIHPSGEELIDPGSPIEVLADGFEWSEGPLWWKEEKAILFSDVPTNTVYIWRQNGEGALPYIKPSGYTGVGKYSNEPGSNGLTRDLEGNLLLCEHGDRRISHMPLNKPGGKRTLTDHFNGKKLNSPNDVIVDSKGKVYFTDPPYGMPKRHEDEGMETGVFGVYLFEKGKTTLVVNDLQRPNGLAMSPDEKFLYVGQSDMAKPHIMKYPVLSNGLLGKGIIFFDCSPLVKQGLRGAPDGMKVDEKGNIWTTGPGGVLVISSSGELLARVETGQATANCAWGDDGSTLYMTADRYLCRVKTKVKGVPFR